jgi:hypothetical protein
VGVAPSATRIDGVAVFAVTHSVTVPWQPRAKDTAGPRVSRMRQRVTVGALNAATAMPASAVCEMSQPSITGLADW